MSWIKENKFAATIIGATTLVSGALVYLGASANSDAGKANMKEQAAVNKINTLQASIPYPSIENEEVLADNLVVYAADTKKFQEDILRFRPETLPQLTADQFSSEVSRYIKKLNKYYRSKKIKKNTKERVAYGMEKYEERMASENSTSYLSYQMQALEWLFTELADSGIDSLNNVHRPLAAENLGNVSRKAPTSRRRSARNKPDSLSSVYDSLPIEITFRSTETSLQEFVSTISTDDQYFFAIKYIKILNEEQKPVTISSVAFTPATAPAVVEESDDNTPKPTAESPFDNSAIFEFEDTAAPVDKKIIKQVIGDEKLIVFMRLELILFKDANSVIIPRLAKTKSDKEPLTNSSPK